MQFFKNLLPQQYLRQTAVALLSVLGEAVSADRADLDLQRQVVEAVVHPLMEGVVELLLRALGPLRRILQTPALDQTKQQKTHRTLPKIPIRSHFSD